MKEVKEGQASEPAAKAEKNPGGHAVDLEGLFADFLTANPQARLAEFERRWGKGQAIENPWNDPSLVLSVANNPEEVADALNKLVLPERFSAIWHKDTKNFEVIWTAFTSRPKVQDLSKRSFVFTYNEKDYECGFGECSDRLLVLAKAFRATSATNTNYRNLPSIQMYADSNPESRNGLETGKPISFWVKSIDWDEDQILIFFYSLNFYMSYFDDDTPLVIIHAPRKEATTGRRRFLHGSFPPKINSRPIDQNLLFFWGAANDGDEARRFIYYFRIIEYASHLYVDSATRVSLKKLLSSPSFPGNIQSDIESLILSFQEFKMDDYARFSALLSEVLDPDLLWPEIAKNMDAFTSSVEFDGGYKLKPLIAAGTTKDQFKVHGISNFSIIIRDMRNALSHGRDMKTSMVIAPTHRNFALLAPWVVLIGIAAGEVILYGDVL